jgi:transcriptional regulator with XRE-family HTH domain
MKDIRVALPARIRELRIKAGMTQEELGLRCETSQSNISRAENGQYGRFTMTTLIKIANGLGMAFVGDFISVEPSEPGR